MHERGTTLVKVTAHIKRTLLWWMIQGRASARGLDIRNLQRVEEYLRVSLPRSTPPIIRVRAEQHQSRACL